MTPAHSLDRPVWGALNSRVAPLAIRRTRDGGSAVRRDPDVGVFVAAADATPESRGLLNALCRELTGAGLVGPEDDPIAFCQGLGFSVRARMTYTVIA